MTPNTTKVVTGKVRLSYVALLEPKAFEGQEAKYSTVILIPKQTKSQSRKLKTRRKLLMRLPRTINSKGVKWERVKTTLRDGDEEMDTEEHPEYAGHVFMSVSSKTKPQIIDKYKTPLTQRMKFTLASMLAYHNAYAYNTAGNKGISCGLNNVQIVAKGDYLGGRSSADADFDEWNEEEDEDDILQQSASLEAPHFKGEV